MLNRKMFVESFLFSWVKCLVVKISTSFMCSSSHVPNVHPVSQCMSYNVMVCDKHNHSLPRHLVSRSVPEKITSWI